MENLRGAFGTSEKSVYYHNNEEVIRNSGKLPFDDIYWKLINYLKAKGYDTHADPLYEKKHKCLKKDHYKAIKGEVCVLFNKYPAGFKAEIDLHKNHMAFSPNFWSSFYSEYTKPTYMQQKRIELVVKHIADFMRTIENISELPAKPKNRIEQLWYDEKRASHIHDAPTNFNELKAYCDKNIPNYNSKDANGNILKCGQTKYLYLHAFGNRLCRAEVWHNINNMWWALINGNLYNEASYRFFDFNTTLPKKNPAKAKDKVNSLIDKYSKEMNFEKCIILRNHLQTLSTND